MTEPKQMATFIALGGIATAFWFKREFLSPGLILKTHLRNWCIKLNLSDAIACACQNFQREDGYIKEYVVEFEELKQLFGEMSLPRLIDLFKRNT